MKLTKKQISLGALAAVAVIAVPVATVASCGKDSKSNSTGTDTGSTGTDTGSTGTDTGSTGTDTGSTGTNTPVVDTASHKTIDLNNITTTKMLFDKLGSTINNTMPTTAFELSALNPSDSSMPKQTFDNINKYMNGIDTKINTITFKLNDKTFDWDLTKLTKTIEEVKTEMKLGFSNLNSFNFPALISADNPAMAVYVAKQATEGSVKGMLVGMKLMGFTLLPGKAFEAYTQMLREYNALSKEFIATDIYKEWIKGKNFILPIGDLLASKIKTETIEPGKKYDDKNDKAASAGASGFTSTEFAKNENSNFAAQWVFTIMDLY
ncbi:hypothetical protein MYMA111404_04015 [Mycoplasma marinum]|uniref:Variable surface lipoprotein n=1 Tax=Mycoplasma marinum TaxID=1937190 RepID=A0A4V2NI01_9MOLU|nr:hypothetical protein [Mycoplasma marinum]TCG10878.1 hypothetical protein C4B24_03640 [Mycoplasma marinum]